MSVLTQEFLVTPFVNVLIVIGKSVRHGAFVVGISDLPLPFGHTYVILSFLGLVLRVDLGLIDDVIYNKGSVQWAVGFNWQLQMSVQ